MTMQKPQELFTHELSDMLDAEQRISKMLPTMVQETEHTEIKAALEHHLGETKQQIANLEQCFQILSEKPESATCFAVDGMRKEHESFLKEKPSTEILTLFNLSGAAKTESYEISSYTGLIDLAKLLGQTQCVQLLEQNLQQEEAMAKKVLHLSRQFGKQAAAKA